jgi:hypothetical protein
MLYEWTLVQVDLMNTKTIIESAAVQEALERDIPSVDKCCDAVGWIHLACADVISGTEGGTKGN